MSWYDVELLELAPDYDAAEVAGVLGVEPRSLRALALPATVRRGLSESDAEVLFHHLHRAGAQVRLQASPRSSGPPPASSLPLPDLPLPDLAQPLAGSPYTSTPTSTPRSTPRPSVRSFPSSPPSTSRPPLLVGSQQREVTGSFAGALLASAAYPFSTVGVVAITVGVSLFVSLALFVVPYMGWLWFWAPLGAGLSALAAYFCAVIRHGSRGREGAPIGGDAPAGDEGWGVLGAGLRVAVALYFVPVVSLGLAMVYAEGSAASVLRHPPVWVHGVNLIHSFLLPASLMLAASTTGCLGGLNYPAAVQVVARVPLGYLGLYAALVPGYVVLGGIPIGAFLALSPISGFLAFFVSVFGVTLALTYIGRALGSFMWFYGDETGL